MLHHQVAKGRRFNQSLFGLIHIKPIGRLGLIFAQDQFLLERQYLSAKPSLKLMARVVPALAPSSLNISLVKRIFVCNVLPQIAYSFHQADLRQLPTKRPAAILFRAKAPERTLPLRTFSSSLFEHLCARSRRQPTFVFELERALFRFNAHTPALDPLFQLPPEIGQSMLRAFL